MIKDKNDKKAHSEFYEQLSEKLEIYDPLDREFVDGAGEKMNIPRADLLNTLFNELTPIKGGEVYAPFSQAMLNKFNKLFSSEYAECERIVSEWCK